MKKREELKRKRKQQIREGKVPDELLPKDEIDHFAYAEAALGEFVAGRKVLHPPICSPSKALEGNKQAAKSSQRSLPPASEVDRLKKIWHNERDYFDLTSAE